MNSSQNERQNAEFHSCANVPTSGTFDQKPGTSTGTFLARARPPTEGCPDVPRDAQSGTNAPLIGTGHTGPWGPDVPSLAVGGPLSKQCQVSFANFAKDPRFAAWLAGAP